MTTGGRILVAVVGGTVLVVGMLLAVFGVTVARAGSVEVDLREDDGSAISVQAPAGLIDLVLFFIPDGSLSRLAVLEDDPEIEELQRHLPAVRDAWRQLMEADDFTAVEVRDNDALVRVEKRAGRLVVHVEDGDSRYDVTLPLGTVSRALRKI